jgi:3-oxoacyl-[acyl-carrier protein] reductase
MAESQGLLHGRTALVVGGGSGIGRAITEAFAAAGADVVAADRKNAQLFIDVTDEESVRSAVAEASLVEMDLATWAETIAVDLTGVFLCCRHVVPGMVERRFGRVINIASQLGIKGGRDLAHYSAAKAGVIGLTKSLALEVAQHGVLVNAIAPGPIETPLVEGITEEWKAAKRKELPLGRFGIPEEVAPTAVLLASDPGGNLFVGQTLGPNSGDVMP